MGRSLDCSELDGGSVKTFLVGGDGREVKPSKGRPRGAGGEEDEKLPNMMMLVLLLIVDCGCWQPKINRDAIFQPVNEKVVPASKKMKRPLWLSL